MRNPNWTRDELILALDLYFNLDPSKIDKKNNEVIKLSKFLNELQIHTVRPDATKFRNSSGVSMKLNNFKRFDPNISGKGLVRGGRLEENIWEEFSEKREELRRIAEIIKLTTNTKSITAIFDDEESEFPEGQILYRRHKYRERSSKVVKEKKEEASKNDNLKCEVCGFDFFRAYGDLGKGYIECHHIIPISQYKQNDTTKIEDLALVCSNCHRMLHRKRPWMSIEELSSTYINHINLINK